MKQPVIAHLRGVVLVLLILPILYLAPGPAAATEFLSSLKDMPIPAGFREIEDDQIKFDTPNGRIISTHAVGKGLVSAVRKFYMGSLPQLGWQTLDKDRYKRDGEILRLTFRQKSSQVDIHFRLAPAQ